MAIQPISPAALRELFLALDEEQKAEVLRDLYRALQTRLQHDFLELIARDMPAEMLFFIVHCLSVFEQKRFTDMVHNGLNPIVSSLALGNAIDVVRNAPTDTREELAAELGERMRQTVENIEGHAQRLEEVKLKRKQDRKPDPDTIRRNVEICDRHRQDPKKWNKKRLAREYAVTDRYIRGVIKEEAHWRRQAQIGSK